MPVDITIRAGDLRHRLKLYQRTVTKDPATGADAISYELYLTVWAELNPTGGRKFFDGGRFNAEQIDTAAIRYRSGLDETMRAELNGRTFEVLAIGDVGERKTKLMLALRELT